MYSYSPDRRLDTMLPDDEVEEDDAAVMEPPRGMPSRIDLGS
jgi:hypothetical protein